MAGGTCVGLEKHRGLNVKRKARNAESTFWLQSASRCFYTRAFWLCMVHALNKRFCGKAMGIVCTAMSATYRIYFVTFSRNVKSMCFFANEFCLCVVHTLNKRFRGDEMFLVCQTMSAKHRIHLLASSLHVSAFTRRQSCCALCIH